MTKHRLSTENFEENQGCHRNRSLPSVTKGRSRLAVVLREINPRPCHPRASLDLRDSSLCSRMTPKVEAQRRISGGLGSVGGCFRREQAPALRVREFSSVISLFLVGVGATTTRPIGCNIFDRPIGFGGHLLLDRPFAKQIWTHGPYKGLDICHCHRPTD